jgi:hypothetical protein
MTDLTRDDMIEGLRELVRELHARGEAGGVRIVGGAAMLLRYYGERRVTPDIDAKLHPESPAIRIAQDIARRRGWDDDWLNAKAATFIPIAIDVGWEPLYDDDDVSVWVISPEALLAMKIRASRPTRDDADIAVLLALTGIRTVDEAEELYERYYPGELPRDAAYLMLEDILAAGLPDPPPAPPTSEPAERSIEFGRRGADLLDHRGSDRGRVVAAHAAATSMSTFPTVPASTASCASAARSSGNRVSGNPAASPTGSAPSSSARVTSSAAAVSAASPTV